MFKQISPVEADDLVQTGDVVIADVRDRASFDMAHIPHAVHLSMQTLQEFCDSLPKNRPIIVYCAHGISSQSVAQHLVEQGFKEVYSLQGGFEVWKQLHPSSKE